MFRDVEKQAGRFIANIEKWGDDEQFPKAVYEMAFPGIEKMPIRNAFPYFKSFLSCSEGIVSVDFVLRDLTPVMRIHYVKSMWNDEKLWKEIFQAEKWTLRMADGTFKEAEQKEALMKAVSAALKSMSSDAQDYINSNFGNTTQYLKNRIEAQIDANHVAAKQAAAQNTLNLG